MAIRWDEFPHNQIRLRIYARLGRNAVGRSAQDSLRYILQRRLAARKAEDHRRFIELEARNGIEHLRCTRDVYREFVEEHKCRPILEAHWVVLRCAVFPTAIALLRGQVIDYATLTRIPGRDLTLLFGIPTRTCYEDWGHGIMLIKPPDPDDDTPATEEELQSLGQLVSEDTLLWFRDIRQGGGVGQPLGGGPFAIDDARAIRKTFAMFALRTGVDLPTWVRFRKKMWHQHAPWSEGLCSLFGSVQDELLSQWRALPSDSLAKELALNGQPAIVVPPGPRLPLRLQRGKECEELAKEIDTIWHKRKYGGLTVAEIQNECSFFNIWKRVEVLSNDDKETFLHPGTWEPGYANLLLGKLYANTRRNFAPGTVNTWRKEYRAYLKWQEENPSKTAEDFKQQLQQVKRGYRKQPHAK